MDEPNNGAREPAPRRWAAPKAFGLSRRPVTWRAYLAVGGVLVLALVIATLAQGGLSPALIGVVPLILVLAIGILVRR